MNKNFLSFNAILDGLLLKFKQKIDINEVDLHKKIAFALEAKKINYQTPLKMYVVHVHKKYKEQIMREDSTFFLETEFEEVDVSLLNIVKEVFKKSTQLEQSYYTSQVKLLSGFAEKYINEIN